MTEARLITFLAGAIFAVISVAASLGSAKSHVWVALVLAWIAIVLLLVALWLSYVTITWGRKPS